jgi:hypothetical protein
LTLTTNSASDTTPPADVEQFSAVSGNQQITLSWTNPSDGDFIGVRIRYRTDRYPVGVNDGVLLGDFTGQPNGQVSTTHAELQNGVTYYYSAASYDLSGNFQSTAYAAAMPAVDGNPGVVDVSAGGGCGMGTITGPDGTPPSSGQSGVNLVSSYLLILFVGLWKWFRQIAAFLRHQQVYHYDDLIHEWQICLRALAVVRPLVRLAGVGQCWRGNLVLEPQWGV